MIKKIAVEKTEGIAEVIDRILEESSDEITLVVPKGSVLGKSPRNFNLLKREADDAGKTVTIESVDANILALAKDAGIEMPSRASSRNVRTGSISDIIPARLETAADEDDEESNDEEEPAPSKKLRVTDTVSVNRKTTVVETTDDDDSETEEEKPSFLAQNRFFKERTMSDIEEEESEEEERTFPWKWVGICATIVIAAGLILYAVTTIFGHANIAINFIKTPWQDQATFTADKSASTINVSNNTIPAQVFSIPKNATQLFPATSEQTVSIKATGMLTIYNAYSSAPQQLVATTRFETPSGQIFRLVNGVTVPGAQVTNGAIVPSSINAEVVADEAGPSYNIGPVAKLTVPGFANSPKEQGFYGTLASSTTGGFVGQKAVPTATDIANAKTAMTSALESDLQSGLLGSYPNNFKILPGASSITITALQVNTTTDANGNFSVFGQATLQAIGFDETALKAFLLSQAQTTEPSSTFASITLNYSTGTPDFTNGRLTFTLNAQASLEPALATTTFENSIEGKSISAARAIVAALPQLENGSISVWPSWLWSIPSNPAKIKLSVD